MRECLGPPARTTAPSRTLPTTLPFLLPPSAVAGGQARTVAHNESSAAQHGRDGDGAADGRAANYSIGYSRGHGRALEWKKCPEAAEMPEAMSNLCVNGKVRRKAAGSMPAVGPVRQRSRPPPPLGQGQPIQLSPAWPSRARPNPHPDPKLQVAPMLQVLGCMKCGTTTLHYELTKRLPTQLSTGRVLGGEVCVHRQRAASPPRTRPHR